MPEASPPAEPAPEPEVEPVSPAPGQAEDTAIAAVDDVPAPEADLVQPEPEPAPVAAGQTRITLSFSGDCWTEIADATGQQLFFRMGHLGQTVNLAGTAPFSVLFGNVENVSVRVDDIDYPISPGNPDSRTARLTILKP